MALSCCRPESDNVKTSRGTESAVLAVNMVSVMARMGWTRSRTLALAGSWRAVASRARRDVILLKKMFTSSGPGTSYGINSIHMAALAIG